MNGSLSLPAIDALKDEARRLRAKHDTDGAPISHSQSLELLAHRYGFKDWNTLHAAAADQPPPPPLKAGDTARGVYLGQPFIGEVLDIEPLTPPGRFRVTLRFEEPVDVVTFDSFSNLRHRVTCTIDRSGKTVEKTSDGRPQMHLELHAAPNGF